MELRINKDKVSHIKIFDVRRGVQEEYWNNKYYKLLPKTRKREWFFIFTWMETYEEAYYRNGEYDKDDMFTSGYDFYTKEEVGDLEGVFIDGDELYTKPIIKIYSNDYLLKSKFFDTLDEAKSYCDNNFPNVNVIFN